MARPSNELLTTITASGTDDNPADEVLEHDKALRKDFKKKLHAKKASLTDGEMAFLHALLVDVTTAPKDPLQPPPIESAMKRLDDDVLFQVPHPIATIAHPETHPIHAHHHDEHHNEHHDETGRPPLFPSTRRSHKKMPKHYRLLVGLWQAHEDGVSPQSLIKSGSKLSLRAEFPGKEKGDDHSTDTGDVFEDLQSIRTDQEVRPEGDTPDDDDDSSDWDEDEGGFHHFDAWQVLKDEYAKDNGFDYTPTGVWEDDEELGQNTFKILGTSAEDTSAHPHVLSPPLMDAIVNFVPDSLRGQNLWMKYSLIRDGASLDTFKRYVRGSKDTILAIETTKGEVFGCYTSSAWRTNFSFYGGAPSFVWRMRHNRNTPCHSLLDQAQMENEIDVYFFLGEGEGQRPQACNSTMIGLGEGNINQFDEEEDEEGKPKNYGFAIALGEDLLSGTSSMSSSYKNPCLVNPGSTGEAFEVLNLELWTFTPCFSLESAEKLEMTQFFVSESLRNTSITSSSSHRSIFSSQDLSRDQFYRRLGHGDDHEAVREQWQYRNMMDGGTQGNKGLGASPRFNDAAAHLA